MLKRTVLICFLLALYMGASAQFEGDYASYKQEGEFGIGVGLNHYFGDLDPTVALNHPKFTAGVYFLKQFNNYMGIKVAGNYAFLAYADKYSSNDAQLTRNLSFNTDIYEFSVSGVFNFFKYIPGTQDHNFTPYVSLGLGVFSYDPYTYLKGQKYYLRALGTEGQGVIPGKKTYGSMAMCFPLAVGVKYSISPKVNLFAELGYRFTTTDYIDDVSTTYAGSAVFVPLPTGGPSPAYQLQDRSGEVVSVPIGIAGRQRGNSTQTDAYVLFHVGLSFNIASYLCPTPSPK